MKKEYRYIVESEFRLNGVLTVLRTNDYEKAVRTTNFWDEKQNTWLIDLGKLTPLERAMRRFDEAIAKFSLREL